MEGSSLKGLWWWWGRDFNSKVMLWMMRPGLQRHFLLGAATGFPLVHVQRAVNSTFSWKVHGSPVLTAATAKSGPEKVCLDTTITKTPSLSTNPRQSPGWSELGDFLEIATLSFCLYNLIKKKDYFF